MNEQTKSGQIALLDQAISQLTTQITHLLDAIDNFLIYGVDGTGGSAAEKIQFKPILETFAELPMRIADEARAIKRDQPRILSREGFELELLNELWITMDTTLWFLMFRAINVKPYCHQSARGSIEVLRTLNKIL